MEPDNRADVLLHVYRFGLTTIEALARSFFEDDEVKAEEFARTMVEEGALTARPLSEERMFYELTPIRFREFSQEGEKGQILGGRALVRAYGFLVFSCHDKKVRREKLLPQEITTHFPTLERFTKRTISFYLEGETLGVCLVDTGRDYRRLIRDSHELVDELMKDDVVQGFYGDRQFAYTLVTSGEEKKEALRKGFLRWRLPVKPRIVNVPELQEIPGWGGR